MLTKLRQYTMALLVLVAAAAGYQAVVTPWLEPPKVESIGLGGDSVLEIDASILSLFPDDAWQRGVCKQLQTADGMLLFQSWEQVENDQWRLWPVTVIVGRGLSSGESTQPILLEAAQGAEIKFTESLDVMSGGAPPIQRGRLIGDVRMYRQSDGSDQGALELITSNVGIDSQKIWTTESVEMTLGTTRLVGRDLTFHLDGPSQPGDSGGGATTVLDRMELIYLDELVMPLEGGSIWGQGNHEGGEKQVGAAMVSLTCGGRVEYDFALDYLSLRDSVSLVHHVEGKLTDRFDCETIEIALNDPMNDSLERKSPLDWIVGVVAEGDPVVAKLPTFDADLAAEQISLNVSDGVIEASGSKGVQLRRGAVTARIAKLHYRFDAQRPDQIGVIDAPGAGIVQVDDPSLPVRRAQWRQGLRVVPKKIESQSVGSNASVAGSTGVESSDDGSVAAVDANTKAGNTTDSDINLAGESVRSRGSREIEFWVEGDILASMADGGDFRADMIAGVLRESSNDQQQPHYIPDRFEITGAVNLNTQVLAAEAERVLLFFVEQPEESDSDPASGSSSEASIRQWVVQPKADDGKVAPVARSRPTIRGESIRAQLLLAGSEIEAKRLSVMGDVEVLHEIKTGTQMLPTRLTGDHLQLIDGGGEDVLQLTSADGVPARLELGDGFFVGPQIQIRPRDNLIWMNDAGEFQLPRAALPLGGTEEGEAGFRWGKTPYCRWNGEMIFDGRTAVLSDGVELDATLIRGAEVWELELSGDRLQAELTEAVDVENVKAMRQASVSTITLMQSEQRPVFIQAVHRGLDGVMEARHLLNAQMLTLKPSDSGTLKADGPGWYRGWVVPKADQPLLASGGNRVGLDSDPNDRPITGAHLVFYDQMFGSFDRQELEFSRGVRVGVRPVESWESLFDAQKMDAISIGESTLDCDQLRFNLEPRGQVQSRIAGVSARWEMTASQGVVFRSRNERGLVEGTAVRAAYSSSKDLFTVEGGPSSPAIFRQTLPDGSPGPEGAVRSMTIRPGTMKVENAVIERLNIATPNDPANR